MRIGGAEFLLSAAGRSAWPPPDLPEVAIAGRSNVGKSSLINALTGRKALAKTSATPGKTQTINFFRVEGRPAGRGARPFLLADLPGYGFAQVPLALRARWRPMVEEYLRERASLRGVVVLIDARRGAKEMDLDLLQWLAAADLPACLALTKADKLKRGERRAAADDLARTLMQGGGLYGRWAGPLLTSAKAGTGRRELLAQIEAWLDEPPRTRPAA